MFLLKINQDRNIENKKKESNDLLTICPSFKKMCNLETKIKLKA